MEKMVHIHSILLRPNWWRFQKVLTFVGILYYILGTIIPPTFTRANVSECHHSNSTRLVFFPSFFWFNKDSSESFLIKWNWIWNAFDEFPCWKRLDKTDVIDLPIWNTLVKFDHLPGWKQKIFETTTQLSFKKFFHQPLQLRNLASKFAAPFAFWLHKLSGGASPLKFTGT